MDSILELDEEEYIIPKNAAGCIQVARNQQSSVDLSFASQSQAMLKNLDPFSIPGFA